MTSQNNLKNPNNNLKKVFPKYFKIKIQVSALAKTTIIELYKYFFLEIRNYSPFFSSKIFEVSFVIPFKIYFLKISRL